MADVVNLRTARKKVARQQSDLAAQANRIAHGQPKHVRKLDAAEKDKARRNLDRHLIETGDRS
jgi:hypothetical protein